MGAIGEGAIIAAVGFHGREWWTRAAAHALTLVVSSAIASSQPADFTDLLSDLSSKIAAMLAPSQAVRVVVGGGVSALQSDVVRLLRARGLTIVDGDAATTVRVGCGENLREYACTAEISGSGESRVVHATRPRDARAAASGEPFVALVLRPLYAQRGVMLDVAVAGDQLLVLEPGGVSLRARTENSGESPPAAAFAPVSTSRVWPRDVRGRLRLTPRGFDAFLPGVTCRGTLKPFAVVCSDDSEPWPIGIANTGLVASRNYFMTPEGLAFVGAAAVAQSTDARWLVADPHGSLAFLDEKRSVIKRDGSADDLVSVTERCLPGSQVIAASRARDADDNDELIHVRIAGDALVLASRAKLPGLVTALWAAPGDRMATAIVRHENGARYEAFHVALSCTR